MTITSPQNPKLKLVRKLRSARRRRREGLFVTEGEDLLEAGLAAGHAPEVVLTAAGAGIAAPAAEEVEPDLLAGVSELGSGTRVIAVWPIPEPAPEESWGPVCVYLDGVGDPANVGAVIRTAAALVDGAVVIGEGTADPYGPKAVRATMGSIFTKPLGSAGSEGAPRPLIGLVAHGGEPLEAAGGPDSEDPLTGGGGGPAGLTVCLGSERDGLSPDLAAACERLVTIPLPGGGAESLNVAASAAILLGRISSAVATPENPS